MFSINTFKMMITYIRVSYETKRFKLYESDRNNYKIAFFKLFSESEQNMLYCFNNSHSFQII